MKSKEVPAKDFLIPSVVRSILSTSTAMAETNTDGDFIVDIEFPGAPPAAPITRAERAEQTDGAEPQHTSEAPIRMFEATSSRPDIASDETSVETSQPSTTSDRSKKPSSVKYQVLGFAGAAFLSVLKAFIPNFFFRPSIEEIKLLNKRQGYDRVIRPKVGDFPEGYPQLASYINSDDTFLVYRKFGRPINRVLIHLQEKLTQLEAELDKLDRDDEVNQIMRPRLAGYEGFEGWDEEQRKLVSKFKTNWLEYAEIILKVSEIETLGKAPERNYLSVYNWTWERKPLKTESLDCYREAEDFVSLAKHAHKDRWAKNWIESYLDTRPKSILRYFLQTEKELDKASDAYVDHYSPGRLELLANQFDVSLATVSLLAPVFVLFLKPMSRVLMCVTASGFLFLSTSLISATTGAKPHEIFLGLAANSAVLFIFLGGMNQSGGGTSS